MRFILVNVPAYYFCFDYRNVILQSDPSLNYSGEFWFSEPIYPESVIIAILNSCI